MRVSFGMVFTRLVLLIVTGLSIWGVVAVLGANADLDDKISLWLALDVPFVTALTLFVATFTALDEKGRLLQGSWLYNLAYGAKWIKDGKVKFCPTFWKLIAIAFIIHFAVGIVGAALFWLGYAFVNHTAVTFMWTGIVVAMILIIVAAIIAKNKRDERRWDKGFGYKKPSKRLSSTFVGRIVKAAIDKACLTIEVAPSEENK